MRIGPVSVDQVEDLLERVISDFENMDDHITGDTQEQCRSMLQAIKRYRRSVIKGKNHVK